MRYLHLITFVFLLTCTSSLAQSTEQFLKVSRPESNQEVLIKEQKRVKLKTSDGRNLKGRLQIVDSNTIAVEGIEIALEDIMEIKRNPLLVSIFTSGALIYVGAAVFGIGILIAAFGQPAGALLTIPAAGMVYLGIKSPSLSRNMQTAKAWQLEIITKTTR